jgi:hypothetical protein
LSIEGGEEDRRSRRSRRKRGWIRREGEGEGEGDEGRKKGGRLRRRLIDEINHPQAPPLQK